MSVSLKLQTVRLWEVVGERDGLSAQVRRSSVRSSILTPRVRVLLAISSFPSTSIQASFELEFQINFQFSFSRFLIILKPHWEEAGSEPSGGSVHLQIT